MTRDLKPKSGLYVTATPIGNLGDMSKRALDILGGADAILCEDTRVTKKLLNYFGISKPLLNLHEHNETKVIPGLLDRLKKGEVLVLVSDAGTPLISDPGYALVRAAQDSGLSVVPVPGASAVISALSASGLATDHFYFAGFLPQKAGQRQKALEDLKVIPGTLIFFESPKRVVETLRTMIEVFGKTHEAVLARELTKIHEEIIRKPLNQLLAELEGRDAIKGEVVLLLERASGGDVSSDYDEVLKALLETLPVGEAASLVAKLMGKSRKEVYSRALEIKK